MTRLPRQPDDNSCFEKSSWTSIWAKIAQTSLQGGRKRYPQHQGGEWQWSPSRASEKYQRVPIWKMYNSDDKAQPFGTQSKRRMCSNHRRWKGWQVKYSLLCSLDQASIFRLWKRTFSCLEEYTSELCSLSCNCPTGVSQLTQPCSVRLKVMCPDLNLIYKRYSGLARMCEQDKHLRRLEDAFVEGVEMGNQRYDW